MYDSFHLMSQDKMMWKRMRRRSTHNNSNISSVDVVEDLFLLFIFMYMLPSSFITHLSSLNIVLTSSSNSRSTATTTVTTTTTIKYWCCYSWYEIIILSLLLRWSSLSWRNTPPSNKHNSYSNRSVFFFLVLFLW